MKIRMHRLIPLILILAFSPILVGVSALSTHAQDESDAAKTQDQEVDVDELKTKAELALQSGDFEGAMDLLEQVIKADPKDSEWKLNLAGLYQQAGMKASVDGEDEVARKRYLRSAELARDVKDDQALLSEYGNAIRSFFGQVFYNEACAHALAGNKDRAMASLKDAFEMGFSDFDLADSDEDLASLRESEEFVSLLKTQKVLQAERLIKETQEELNEFESFEFDFELEDVKGEVVALKDFKDQVLIVDFWGTWCPPCRAEIPSFIRLKKEYGDKGFDIIGLNNEMTDDADEALAKVTEFMKEYEMNYNCAISDSKTEDQVDIEGFPTTLFIDRSGKVRLKLVGLHSFEKLESVVKALLEEKPQN